MIARLLISTSQNRIKEEVSRTLALYLKGVNVNHPDVLYFKAGEKLGITEARKIKEHFSLKPYSLKGRVVIIEDASVMTHEAQNALLKTLEEPPAEAILILGAPSEANFLPTILSRCEITRLQVTGNRLQKKNYQEDIEKLINSSIEERFEYVEKLKEKKEFLHALVLYFRNQMLQLSYDRVTIDKDFLKELLQAEEWARQNVNIRGILEYLMLKMPK